MHRQILEACWPLALLLLAGVACLVALVRLSGARFQRLPLRRLHHCQEGSVQTLSFVFTLPVFLMIVLFILQVSQLMAGIAVVHYATFAAARAAIVWIPADLGDPNEPPNVVAISHVYTLETSDRKEYHLPQSGGEVEAINLSPKYRKIWLAAVQACAPIAPSRALYQPHHAAITNMIGSMDRAYHTLDPRAASNSKISERIQNKIAYSAEHTTVRLEGVDRDSPQGPTYNPSTVTYDDEGNVTYDGWNPHELGWEDPFTITVRHRYALLPGPGRLLAKYIVPADGSTDRVSGRIQLITSDTGERIYTTVLGASLTLSNEGLKSVMPYVQTTD